MRLVLLQFKYIGAVVAAVVVFVHLHATVVADILVVGRKKSDLSQTVHAIMQVHYHARAEEQVEYHHYRKDEFPHVEQSYINSQNANKCRFAPVAPAGSIRVRRGCCG